MSFGQRLASHWAIRSESNSAPDLPPAEIKGTRNAFLAWAYASGLVEANDYSAHLSDKLFFARFLALYAPEAYARFHPRTLVAEEFLGAASPGDWIAKPAAGMSGEGGPLYLGREAVERALNNKSLFSQTEELSPLTGLLSSGRRYLIQERLAATGPELRLHTCGGRVVAGATFTRWDAAWDRRAFAAAENSLAEFLSLLPLGMIRGQAWSVDLLPTATGHKIIEVNTNRGCAGQWSGDLSLPDVLQAYVLHLEQHWGMQFLGMGGEAFRGGRANLEKYISKFGAEAWARHCRLRAEAS